MDKSSESPLVRAALNVMGTKMLLDDRAEAAQAQQEAALQDLLARQHEARRMAPVRRGLRGAGGVAPDTTDYAAAGSLRDYEPGLPLALAFEKGGHAKAAAVNWGSLGQAGAGRVLQGSGAVSKQVGRLVGAAGHGVEQVGQALHGAVPTDEAQQFAQQLRPGLGRRFGGVLQGAGQKARQAGGTVAQAGHNVAQGGRTMAEQAGPAFSKTPAASSASASEPLIGLGTKAKLVAGAGVLGAGYLGMKGLQATRDYMSVPAGQHQVGYLRSDVSPYGY